MPSYEPHVSVAEGAVKPLNIPSNSKIPDENSGLATAEDYDKYFNIVRDNPGLLEWSQLCLSTQDAQLRDLDRTALGYEEKMLIVQGMLLVQRVTLEKWVKACSTNRREM